MTVLSVQSKTEDDDEVLLLLMGLCSSGCVLWSQLMLKEKIRVEASVRHVVNCSAHFVCIQRYCRYRSGGQGSRARLGVPGRDEQHDAGLLASAVALVLCMQILLAAHSPNYREQ
eukprot:5102078-Pleurochrysis_carterae.AAC.3